PPSIAACAASETRPGLRHARAPIGSRMPGLPPQRAPSDNDAMRFCSVCGADRLERKVPAGDTMPRFVCAGCGEIHYQNPKVVVGCLPVWEHRVLLCRRAIEPRLGLWTLPAGFLENGETVVAGAARETLEEAS